MKISRLCKVILAVSFMAAAAVSAAAAEADSSAYSFRAGKAGRIEEAAPYAGMNYEGGEQGDTSGYSFRTGRLEKPWNTAE